MASDPRTSIDWHWPRSHRGLVWGLADAPAGPRLQITAISEGGRRFVAETARGARLLLIGLGTESPSGIEVTPRPSEASKVFISLVDGPTLGPSLRDGPGLEVDWTAEGWHKVRVRAISWGPGAATGPPPATIAASEGRWRLPEGCPGPGPMELVLTPFDAKGRQGPTDSLIVPPRVDRIESPVGELTEVLPPGEVLSPPSNPEPMGSIPSLVERAGETALGRDPGADSTLPTLPPAVLAGLIGVQANSWAWKRALAILGERDGGSSLADYLHHPQYYHQLVDQADFATVSARWGRAAGSPPTAVHQLLHAWQARRGRVTDPRTAATLEKYLADKDDDEIDRWLRLMSAGVSPEILREFLCVRRWAESDGAILRASLLLDKFRRQPAGDLLPELVPETAPHRLASDAARAEEVAASPGGDYKSFARAQEARSAAIEALGRHLSTIERDGGGLATRLRAAVRDLGRDVIGRPVALFRREREAAERGPIDDPEPSSPPVLRFEAILAERRRLDRIARARILRQVADWAVRLFEGRTRSPWPWSGTLSSDDPESAVDIAWGRVRGEVLALPDDAVPPSEVLGLAEALGEARAAAVGAGSVRLGATLSEPCDNAGRIIAWLDEGRARSLLKATLTEGAAWLPTPRARELAKVEVDAARSLIADPVAPLAALVAHARPIRVLIEDEAVWARDLAEVNSSDRPGLARLAGMAVEEARARLADPSWEIELATGEESAWIRSEGLDELATRLGRTTAPPRPQYQGPAGSSAKVLYPEESACLGRIIAAEARLSACLAWASARERAVRDAWGLARARAAAAGLSDGPGDDVGLGRWFEDRLTAGDWDDLARAHDHLGRLGERLVDARWLLLLTDFDPEVPLPRLLAEPILRPEPGGIGDTELHDRLATIARTVRSVPYLVGEPKAAAIDAAAASLRAEVGPLRKAIDDLYQFLWRRGIERFDTLARRDLERARPPRPRTPGELASALDWLDAFRSRPHSGPADSELAEALRDVGLMPQTEVA